MQSKIVNIKCNTINSKDSTFRITTRKTTSDLIQSVSNIGIINPPIVVADKKQYIIVSGFRRIEAAIRQGFSDIHATILETPKNPNKLAKIAISDNSFQRPLNLIEQARAIKLLSPYHNSVKNLAETAKDLSLPANASMIEKLLCISSLDEKIQNFLISETLSMTTVLLLDTLEERNKIPMAIFLASLHLNLNKQREVLTLLTEISYREDKDLGDVLQEKQIIEIQNDKETDIKQKASKIRTYLKKRRFPELTKAETEFHDCIKQLKLDNATKLIPPRSFEGSLFTLNFSFTSLTELMNCQKKLDGIIQNTAIKEIFK